MNQYYVIGNPVEHSLSPVIHAEFAKQIGQAIQFDKQLVLDGEVEAILRELLSDGVKGCAVTVPHKRAAFLASDMLSERAQFAGVVSCIKFADNKIQGDNLDGVGLVKALKSYHSVEIQNKRLLVLGAGGAVQGVLPTLLQENPRQVVVANRTVHRAEELTAHFGGNVVASSLDGVTGEFDIVINGTSASLSHAIPAIPAPIIKKTVCYDMMYSPSGRTVFTDWTKQQGASQCFDGLSMLIGQGEAAFKWWTGAQPDGLALYQALRA